MSKKRYKDLQLGDLIRCKTVFNTYTIKPVIRINDGLMGINWHTVSLDGGYLIEGHPDDRVDVHGNKRNCKKFHKKIKGLNYPKSFIDKLDWLK